MTDQLSSIELERTAAHWLRLAEEGAQLLDHLERQRLSATALGESRVWELAQRDII